MSIRLFSVAILLLALLAGCRREQTRTPVLAEAYTGPMTLSVKDELAPRAATVATLKHGDRVQIIQQRRRFVRVRTPNGAEGWVDGRQLLTPEEIAELNALGDKYANAPSMGEATVHDALNIHTEPNRQAPSFYQIREGRRVDVIGHELAPRVPYVPSRPLIPPKEQSVRKSRPKRETSEKVPKLPLPPPPPLPDDWVERSKPRLVNGESSEAADPDEVLAAKLVASQNALPAKRAAQPKQPVLEDWSLVRTKEGKVGWVLTRPLLLAIPDEVAQYAEGHRITSYFSLGQVQDGDQTKHHWLWTTQSRNAVPYQFDSFRVFVYALRRHRYETAYIERNLKGYYPVAAHPVEITEGGKRLTVPGFSLVVEEKDGSRYKRTYAFQVYRVTLVSKEPWAPPPHTEVSSIISGLKDRLLSR